MKITKSLAEKLILESETFRKFILDVAYQTDKDSLINRIKKICQDKADNKIEAVKAVRQLSITTPESDFFDAYGVSYGDSSILGVMDAKRIVEKYL